MLVEKVIRDDVITDRFEFVACFWKIARQFDPLDQ